MGFFGDFEFYWLRYNVIAGSSRPKSEDNLRFIAKQGIKRIISISQPDLIAMYASPFKIEVIPFEFVDFGIPSYNQIKDFFSIIDDSQRKKLPVLVHCAMGCGRTGLLLTLYLMHYEQKTWEDSLQDVRSVRSCAVESGNQIDFLSSVNLSEI